MKKALIIAALMAGLSACGPLHVPTVLEGTIRNAISGIGQTDSATQAGPSGPITREQIEAQPTDLLRLSIISREVTVIASLGAQNGTKTTWFERDGASVSFDRGVLIGTRGLGDDLMGSDVDGVIAAMSRGGNYARTFDFLDGLDQINRETFQCSMQVVRSETITIFERSYDTMVLQETCTRGSDRISNTYWRDGSGVIWQSRQWVSHGVGYLGYQKL